MTIHILLLYVYPHACSMTTYIPALWLPIYMHSDLYVYSMTTHLPSLWLHTFLPYDYLHACPMTTHMPALWLPTCLLCLPPMTTQLPYLTTYMPALWFYIPALLLLTCLPYDYLDVCFYDTTMPLTIYMPALLHNISICLLYDYEHACSSQYLWLPTNQATKPMLWHNGIIMTTDKNLQFDIMMYWWLPINLFLWYHSAFMTTHKSSLWLSQCLYDYLSIFSMISQCLYDYTQIFSMISQCFLWCLYQLHPLDATTWS